MYELADRLVQDVEQGRLSRREAVHRLVAVAAVVFTGVGPGARPARGQSAKPEPPTFQSRGINHVALRVTDIERSRAFYERHLGLQPLQVSRHNCFLGAGENNFVAMFPAKQAGLDHFCFTIDDYRPDEVVDRLKSEALDPERHEDRVYFDDPDGIQVQLASKWGDYPGGRP